METVKRSGLPGFGEGEGKGEQVEHRGFLG